MKFVNLDESEIIEQPLEKVIARPDYSPVEFVYDDLCSLDSVSVDGIHPSGDDPDLILPPSVNKINNCFKSEYFKISNLFSEIQTYEQKQQVLKNLGILDAINDSSYIYNLGDGLTYNGREMVVNHDLTLQTTGGKLGVNMGKGLYVNPDNQLSVHTGKGLAVNHADSTVEVAEEVFDKIEGKADKTETENLRKALEAENKRAEQAEESLENVVQMLQDETKDLQSIRDDVERLGSDKADKSALEATNKEVSKKQNKLDNYKEDPSNGSVEIFAQDKVSVRNDSQGGVSCVEVYNEEDTEGIIPVARMSADKENGDYASVTVRGNEVHIDGDAVKVNGVDLENVGVTIVNDLTTGGVDKALSAEMGKELNNKMTPFISKLNGAYNSSDYKGIYCNNVNNGNVSVAVDTGNGIVIPVKEGEVYEVVGENLKYGYKSVQFYSGYPSLDTNISCIGTINNKVTAPQGATYMLVSVNPSLGTETTIRQLNWATTEDLPQNYEESLKNIGSEYKTQVINVTQGTAAGNNKMFPISLLGEGDIIQIYVKSDIDTKMSLLTFNGKVILSIVTNQIITKEITADDITGNSFGFYINQSQAIQSGTLDCSLRIIKKDSSSISLSRALANVADTPKNISDINKNIGSKYQELIVNVEADKLLDARTLMSTDVADGYSIELIAECDEDISYRVLTQDGKFPIGLNEIYFSTNVLYREVCKPDFITSLQAGKMWGVYILADNATVSTTIHFKVRLISNDTFSLQHTIDNAKEQANSLERVAESIAEIPVNNKNIKNWNIANELVTRLYVENKELALADGLFIRQFFRALNNPKNNGFNFGTRNTSWAVAIAPSLGDFDYYETTSYKVEGVQNKYGKIAIRIENWDAIEWPSNGTISIGALSESNLEDIVFDWDEFIKPLHPTAIIADGYITENKLSEEVRDKLNSSTPPLSRYELFSLGDSLSAAGVWQTKVAQLTGCIFDQGKNNKGGAMLSVGGTTSYGDTFDNVLWRTKNLIDQNYIAGQGENAIVILENVNDGYMAFDGDVQSIIPTTPIEGYNDVDFGVELLESISNKAALNAVLRLNKVVAGKNLKIDTLPTKAGTVTLTVGWAGPGYSNYNIYVEPQATQEETLSHVLDKILEYAYTGITDTLGEDGVSVDFSSGNSNYLPTVQFTDTDGTGMVCTVTDNPNAKGSVARYFIGDSVSEWTDTSKWQKGITYSQGWKSSIELLQRTYPKLHIFVSLFPLHSVTASEYLLPNGSYDTAAYNSVSRMETMRKMQVELNNIAKFYSLPFLDVFTECGIGINNMLTYYNASANVHPKNEGYYRFGETVAAQLKRYLI